MMAVIEDMVAGLTVEDRLIVYKEYEHFERVGILARDAMLRHLVYKLRDELKLHSSVLTFSDLADLLGKVVYHYYAKQYLKDLK